MTDQTSCNHCWHDAGMQLLTNPPQNVETCCNCGLKKYTAVYWALDDKTVAHGPYLPGKRWGAQEPAFCYIKNTLVQVTEC